MPEARSAGRAETVFVLLLIQGRSSRGLKFPTFLMFTETDPTTLNYFGT